MTTHLLYALLAETPDDADQVFESAVAVERETLVDAIRVTLSDVDTVVLERSPHRVYVRRADLGDRAAVTISASAITPEAVGLCWEVLVALHLLMPSDVWLSTYNRETLEAATSASLPPVQIQQRPGYVLTPSQFDQFLTGGRA